MNRERRSKAACGATSNRLSKDGAGGCIENKPKQESRDQDRHVNLFIEKPRQMIITLGPRVLAASTEARDALMARDHSRKT